MSTVGRVMLAVGALMLVVGFLAYRGEATNHTECEWVSALVGPDQQCRVDDAVWAGGQIGMLSSVGFFVIAGILAVESSRAGTRKLAMGWYPDPGGAGRWRWWDGRRWTGQTRPF
jgi:Protein of unknown function (DUF2510)